MIAGSLLTNEERVGNLGVGASLSDQTQHLELAIRQGVACHEVSRVPTGVCPNRGSRRDRRSNCLFGRQGPGSSLHTGKPLLS